MKKFTQKEYNNVLESHNARSRGLSQSECEQLLIQKLGVSINRARNAAYVYLHHGNYLEVTQHATQDEYDQILDDFGAISRTPIDCIRHLENMGYSYFQAKSGVHKYRKKRNLIRPK